MQHEENLDRPCPPVRFLIIVGFTLASWVIVFGIGAGLIHLTQLGFAKLRAAEVRRAK